MKAKGKRVVYVAGVWLLGDIERNKSMTEAFRSENRFE